MAAEPEPRAPLNRDRILRAALDLADERGIDSLTMRKLAQALGFEAMSLYNYVSNKDDLLDGILDLVLAEAEPPAPTGDWASAIRASAISVHAALGRHPWASALLMSPGRVRPERLRHMDLLLGRLREAGFSAATTYTAYHVIDAHILGFSLWHAGHSYVGDDIEDLVAWFTQSVTAETYPYLQEHARQHVEDGPHREVSAFELGLDLILDGLRRMQGALPADEAS